MIETARRIVEETTRLGIQLRINGDKIRVTLPDGDDARITAAIEDLRSHRDEVIALLREGPEVAHALSPALDKKSEGCLHCKGAGRCRCITCGHYQALLEWTEGDCVPCKQKCKTAEMVQ